MNIRAALFAILIVINTNAAEENDEDYEDVPSETTLYDYEEEPARERDNYEITPDEEQEADETEHDKNNYEESSTMEDNRGNYKEPANKQKQASSTKQDKARMFFHEQGLKGPHSYRYGYDTGGNKNRMTKYEERDNKGNVKGSYSFRDAHGKVQTVNYEAHPKYGFRASGSFGTFPRTA